MSDACGPALTPVRSEPPLAGQAVLTESSLSAKAVPPLASAGDAEHTAEGLRAYS